MAKTFSQVVEATLDRMRAQNYALSRSNVAVVARRIMVHDGADLRANGAERRLLTPVVEEVLEVLSREAYEPTPTQGFRCVRCDGRLGAQNPHDMCDTCRLA